VSFFPMTWAQARQEGKVMERVNKPDE